MTENLDSDLAYATKVLEAERRMRYGVFRKRPELRVAKVAEIDRVIAFVRHLADEYKRLKEILDAPLPDVNWCLHCGSGYEGENPYLMCWRCAYDLITRLLSETCAYMQKIGQQLEETAARNLKRLRGDDGSAD